MVVPLTKGRFFTVTIIVTAISLVGSFINFVSQAVLAYTFGASVAVDAYSYALSLPIFISGLIGILISYTVIPMLAKSASDAIPGEIGQALSFLMLSAALLFALTGLTAGWWQPVLLPAAKSLTLFAGLDTLIGLAWVVGAIQILVALATAQLNASGRPIIAAWLGLPTNCVTIIALLVAADRHISFAIGGMAVGAGVSAAIGFWFARDRLLPPRVAKRVGKGLVKRYAISAFWASLALSCFASYALVDAIWAPRLGEGALASMGYAHRIIIGLGSLVVAGPSALFVPRFATLIESGQRKEFRRLLLSALGFTGFVGGALALGLYFFADLIVQLLFERGAFDSSASATVADVLRHMAPGMTAMLFSVITLRAIFCLPNSERAAAAMGFGFTASYALFSYLLLGEGVVGIATAYSISWIGFFMMLLSYVTWQSRQLGR